MTLKVGWLAEPETANEEKEVVVHSWKQRRKKGQWLVLDNAAVVDEVTFIYVESGASVNTADVRGTRSFGDRDNVSSII